MNMLTSRIAKHRNSTYKHFIALHIGYPGPPHRSLLERFLRRALSIPFLQHAVAQELLAELEKRHDTEHQKPEYAGLSLLCGSHAGARFFCLKVFMNKCYQVKVITVLTRTIVEGVNLASDSPPAQPQERSGALLQAPCSVPSRDQPCAPELLEQRKRFQWSQL
ncbi:hypothetical protein CB1_001538005 [Camelus ferus]|nr:hypothetical protein CB1_001538005 [Camelus ferus]